MLESVGASLGFSCYNHDIAFSIHCLKKDVAMVLELLAEQLREPAFNPENLALQKKRTIGDLLQAKDDTHVQAEIALSQTLFPEGHPNYDDSIDMVIEQVEKITTEDLKTYHATAYGLGNLVIVASGDIDTSGLETLVEKVFRGWRMTSLARTARTLQGRSTTKDQKIISIPDKTSVDVNIGLSLGIDRNHPDFYPFSVGNNVFGGQGGLNSRLMSTVREKDGLTYRIYSGIGGVREGDDGYWYLYASFSPDLFKKGLNSIDVQLQKWCKDGITAKELETRKSKIIGGYQVGLATTRGLASMILNAIEQGKSKDFLDQYPEIIRAVTLTQVNDTIKRYVDPKKLVTIAAGSIDSKGNPLEK